MNHIATFTALLVLMVLAVTKLNLTSLVAGNC